ncbi:MAG: three-Cys-motif partner protein TcmP [Candidatus Delongbacteria bacterium]|jgi:three-Cys-motif partner protein|nr:three-Cys-motif partner protein TcmP [Candidatus Delongbacteria bacterium]
MSKADSFFDEQTGLTAAKIEIYKKYIEGYLPKLLMQFKECIIADLFCGVGKNGEQDGSPLILIDRSKYILTSPQLKSKNAKIQILFNDSDEKNIQNLNEELKKLDSCSEIKIIDVLNKNFEELFPQLIEYFKNSKIPKFFFLDPFSYSNIKMENLRQLMDLQFTEVLLFIPIFHSYRFASDIKMSENHKTRIFVEEFTKKGIADYENTKEFMYSVKEKIMQDLSLKYVRPVLLDDGSKKNSLFLLTKHRAGMLQMNKIAIKLTDDGSTIKVKEKNQQSLFGVEVSSNFDIYKQKLISQIKMKRKLSNSEIVEFTIVNEFLPKHANLVLKDLFEQNNIIVYDENKIEVKNKKQWNIAESTSKVVYFEWMGEL